MSLSPTARPKQPHHYPRGQGPGGQSRPVYYMDDAEGYVGDYSESEGLSDSGQPQPPPPQRVRGPPPPLQQPQQSQPLPPPPTDVQELYRRNAANCPPGDPYRQNLYLPPEYYYEHPLPPPPPGARHSNSPPLYQKRVMVPPPPPPRNFYPDEEVAYEHHPHSVYHPSLPQLAPPPRPAMMQRVPSATMMRQRQHQQMQMQQMQHQQKRQQQQQQQQPAPHMMKRHPITVRTPRYVRRPTAGGLYKRPSALCLPIACQPDPGMYRRVRRVVQPPPDGGFQHQQQQRHPPPQDMMVMGRRQVHSAPIYPNKQQQPQQQQQPPPARGESGKSVDMTQSRLDAILERYEKIFGKNPDVEGAFVNEQMGDQEMAKHLQPRIPPSLKEQQQQQRRHVTRITKQQIPEIMKNAETFEVEEITSDVLDELLSELTEHGFRDVMNLDCDPRQQQQSEGDSRQTLQSNLAARLSPRSILVPDTKLIVGKCDTELTTTAKNSQIDIPVKDVPKSYNYEEIKESLEKITHLNNDFNSESEASKSSLKISSTPKKSVRTSSNVSKDGSSKLNAHDAMELHRTKSYVVNLIDTALSSHFGTNVCEKSAPPIKEYMDPKSAVEMLKKHSSGKMDKELCLEIAQVLTDSFVSNNSAPSNCGKTTSECTCSKTQIEEPTFVKQLKQMRWGHLKHIQREVRRLEDLERFLDSCSVSSFEKYTH